ncbi:hypothetical protein HDK77DRAFT_308626 [Phyllosticta capitalensis]|uniref:uncharacterized protein n=1 Tax=Phyllosticta capitalensis TaxID=121624 RepID=UPI00312E888C
MPCPLLQWGSHGSTLWSAIKFSAFIPNFCCACEIFGGDLTDLCIPLARSTITIAITISVGPASTVPLLLPRAMAAPRTPSQVSSSTSTSKRRGEVGSWGVGGVYRTACPRSLPSLTVLCTPSLYIHTVSPAATLPLRLPTRSSPAAVSRRTALLAAHRLGLRMACVSVRQTDKQQTSSRRMGGGAAQHKRRTVHAMDGVGGEQRARTTDWTDALCRR